MPLMVPQLPEGKPYYGALARVEPKAREVIYSDPNFYQLRRVTR